jgi:hydroxyacylglutathione hydrolase
MNLIFLPIFNDNYIWILHNNDEAIVVDPGIATPVIEIVSTLKLRLKAILITHHHADHIGGVADLKQHLKVPIFAPRIDSISTPYTTVTESDCLALLGLSIQVFSTPGHTANHICYYVEPKNETPILFCGDTLFSAGCGRLLGGTAKQLENSLNRLATLPADTRVCCAHEYTEANLKFAVQVDSNNPHVHSYQHEVQLLRQAGLSTLPSSIGLERNINPFLRCHHTTIQESVARYDQQLVTQIGTFSALRAWKNIF